MKFDDFENAYKKENKILRYLMVFTLLSSFITFSLVITEKREFFSGGGEILKERPLLEDVCKEAFLSIVDNRPSEALIDNRIVSLLKKEPFEMKEAQILKLKGIGKDSCRIIVSSEGRLRSFISVMSLSDANDFYYKLSELKEVEPKEDA